MLQKRSIPILVFIFLCFAACEEPEDAVLPTNDFIPTPPCEGICCEDPSSCGLDPGVPDDDEVDRTGLTITGSGTDDDPYVYSFKIFYEYDYSGTTDPVGAYLNHLSNGNYYAPEGFIIDGLYHKRGHYREPKDNEGPTAIIKRKGFKGSKADCVYKLLTNGGEFSKFIKRFDGDFPVSHLIFELSTTIPGNGRTTDDPTSYFITIQINANTLNSRPTLGVARTIAHEVIHAEMDRKLKSIGYDAQIAGKAFPGIYDYYRRYVKGWQHQQMAAHYISTIADIVEDFDHGRSSRQFYEDIAWDGLIYQKNSNGNAYLNEAWKQLSSQEQQRIVNNINTLRNSTKTTCP